MSEVDYSKFKVESVVPESWYIYNDDDGTYITKRGDLVTMFSRNGDPYWPTKDEAILFLEGLSKPKQPTSKYKTKPIDYTGCDPVIAEHLKRGESIECECYNVKSNKTTAIEYILWFDASPPASNSHYIGEVRNWQHATPVSKKQYVKKASEIVKWFEDNGWSFYNAANHAYWYDNDSDMKFFVAQLAACGKPITKTLDYLPKWLEWR